VGLRLLYLVEDCVHAMEEREIVRIGEVDLVLDPLDALEPDIVLEVDATDGSREDLNLLELSMKKLSSISERQMCALL
jgi:hypothetical protein